MSARSKIRMKRSPTAMKLEDRIVPALFVVTNGNDGGLGSLRNAIALANKADGADSITFDPSVSKVSLTSGELLISDNLQIIGPGADKLTVDGGKLGFRVFHVEQTFGEIAAGFTGITITGGQATGAGGGIYSYYERVTIIDCRILGNSALTHGGGIYVYRGNGLLIEQTLISGNTAGQVGGGIYVADADFRTKRSTISNNVAGTGGGIGFVGDVHLDAERWSIVNSTIAENSSTVSFGGGIGLVNTAVESIVFITNSTITSNSAATIGGGIGTLGGTASITLESSVVSGNNGLSSPEIAVPNVTAGRSALGSSSGIKSFTDSGGNLPFGVPLNLGPLANNGGPTPTFQPMTGSPLINAGGNSNPANFPTDQRGFPRVTGGQADIGAIETASAASFFVVTSTSDSGPGSLRQAVLDANASLDASVISFDPVLFAVPQSVVLTSGALTITSSVVIEGPGAALLTVSGNNSSRIFAINDNVPTISQITIRGLTISDGVANNGGGLLAGSDTTTSGNDFVTIDQCVFRNCVASTSGGGLYIRGGTIALIASQFTDNSATTIGGGLFVQASSSSFRDCTIDNNQAASGGGVTLNSYAMIRNCTISSNSATNGPGGGVLQLSGNSLVYVWNSTVTLNNSTAAGGGIDSSATVEVESSIISNNANALAPDISSPRAKVRTSAIGSISGINNFTDYGGNLAIGAALNLGPLQDNGGPTPTHALLLGSPAIESGSNPALPVLSIDQRGLLRVSGDDIDIGAFEFQQPPQVLALCVNDGSAQRSIVNRITVAFSEAVSFPNGIASAFQLTRIGPGGPNGSVNLSAVQSGNFVTLQFVDGGTVGTDPGASLRDGIYRLTVFADQLQGLGGNLDGNGDLVGGDSFTTPTTGASRIYRLFGDADGNAIVNSIDFAAFRGTFGLPSVIFDFNNDGNTGSDDFAEFRKRFGLMI